VQCRLTRIKVETDVLQLSELEPGAVQQALVEFLSMATEPDKRPG
jgi:hypothetical protein